MDNIENCSQNDYLLKRHKCSECNFKSVYKWVTLRHYNAKHNKSKLTVNNFEENMSAKIISSGTGGLTAFNEKSEAYDMRWVPQFKYYISG